MINFKRKNPEATVEVPAEETLPMNPETKNEESENLKNSEINSKENIELDGKAEKSGNFNESFLSEAKAYAKGKQIGNDQLDSALAFLNTIRKAGECDIEMLECIIHGLDYSRAVSAAYNEGELQGRNTQIEEKYMRPQQSDGMPHPGGNGAANRSSRKTSSIFDLARSAGV